MMSDAVCQTLSEVRNILKERSCQWLPPNSQDDEMLPTPLARVRLYMPSHAASPPFHAARGQPPFSTHKSQIISEKIVLDLSRG